MSSKSKSSFRDGALAPDPESRDSGFDAPHRSGMTGPTHSSVLPLERFRRSAACARHQFLVGFGQRLAEIAKPVGDRVTAVAAEIPACYFNARGRLPPLVFGDVEQAMDPHHHLGM